LCAGNPGAEPAIRTGVEVLSFPDASSRWWRLAKRLVLLPDSERPWADRLAKTALTHRLVAQGDVLVTFGQPMSDHLAGLAIKRALDIPWIAHFSDPWSDNPYLSRNPVVPRRLRAMERRVVDAADRLLFTSQETVDLVMKKYSAPLRAKVGILPHAYDPQFQAEAALPARRDGNLVLRHLGNFYGRRNPLTLIQALVLLHKRQPAVLENVRIELIGRWVGRKRWSPADLTLPKHLLSFHQPIAYEESLRQMRSADALLIIDAPFERNVFFPSKLVDYLWARRPVLALTPPGTSADIVAACGGLVASPATPETIAAGLADMIVRLRARTIGAPSEEAIASYDARRVAAAFDETVRRLCSSAFVSGREAPHVTRA
jgi:glycosyltransferase involved in cell wall biosynthesis